MQLYITLLGAFKSPNQKNEGGGFHPPGINGPKYPGISRVKGFNQNIGRSIGRDWRYDRI